ncbi:hypothetical protein RUND412_010198 [Rhizina undulata]
MADDEAFQQAATKQRDFPGVIKIPSSHVSSIAAVKQSRETRSSQDATSNDAGISPIDNTSPPRNPNNQRLRMDYKAPKMKSLKSVIFGATETATGLPSRVPANRLERGKKRNENKQPVLEEVVNSVDEDEEGAARNGRRIDALEFEAWADQRARKEERPGVGEQRRERMLWRDTARTPADTNISKDQPKPGGNNSRGAKTVAIQDPTGNYKNVDIENHRIGTSRSLNPSEPQLRTQKPVQSSVASLLLAHASPKSPQIQLPTPPLSLLQQQNSTTPKGEPPVATAMPEILQTPKPSAPPLLSVNVENTPKISPGQQMRQLRAQFDALYPPSQPQQNIRNAPPKPAPSRPAPAKSREIPTNPPAKPIYSSSTAAFARKYTFSLRNLPPIKHHSKTAVVSLRPPTSSPNFSGDLYLDLRDLEQVRGGGRYTYLLKPDAGPIKVADKSSGREQTFALEDLPLKHLHAYRYGSKFVQLVRRRTVILNIETADGVEGRVWGDDKFEMRSKYIRVEIWRISNEFEFQKEENEVQMRVWRKDQIVWKGDCAVKDGKIEIREDCNGYARDAKKAARMWRWCKKALAAPPGAIEQPWEISTTYPETQKVDQEESAPETQGEKWTELSSPNSRSPSPVNNSDKMEEIDATYRLVPETVFIPRVGWCTRTQTKTRGRAGQKGKTEADWWSMLFLDGVRLEIDGANGDAVWIEENPENGKRREKKVLKGGMRLKSVRERVARFVDAGL